MVFVFFIHIVTLLLSHKEHMLRTNVLCALYYTEHIFACQYFSLKNSNKYSEYMFAFYGTLCYSNNRYKFDTIFRIYRSL